MCCSSCCCCCCFCQAAAIFSQHTLLACLECWRLQEAAAAALCAMLVLLVVQRAAAHVSTSAYVCLTGSSGGSGAPLQAGSCVAVTAGCFDCCCCRCCSIGHLAVAPASAHAGASPPPRAACRRHSCRAAATLPQLAPWRFSCILAACPTNWRAASPAAGLAEAARPPCPLAMPLLLPAPGVLHAARRAAQPMQHRSSPSPAA